MMETKGSDIHMGNFGGVTSDKDEDGEVWTFNGSLPYHIIQFNFDDGKVFRWCILKFKFCDLYNFHEPSQSNFNFDGGSSPNKISTSQGV
jgi:hypothetical protein